MQGQVEELRRMINKLLATTYKPFLGALYTPLEKPLRNLSGILPSSSSDLTTPPIHRPPSILPDFVIRTLSVVGPRVPRVQPGGRYHRLLITAQVVGLTARE